ncbi:MAG: hypothetical protein ACOYM2_16550 [Rectinemataceae bacterium]
MSMGCYSYDEIEKHFVPTLNLLTWQQAHPRPSWFSRGKLLRLKAAAEFGIASLPDPKDTVIARLRRKQAEASDARK